MLVRFLQTFQFFPVSLAWYTFQYEPQAYMRRRILLMFSTVVAGLYLCGCPLWVAVCLAFCFFECGIRLLFSL